MIKLPQHLSVSWLKKAYQNHDITPEQVIKVLLERSENYKDYNVWITPPSEDIYAPYLEALKSFEPNDPKKPLWGIPFAIKDNIDLINIPTTAACPEYSYTPHKSATVVQKIIDAGAIPLGKTNLDQFATGLVGTRSPYGECKNALRPELISGGSSSGSAVSVALGIVSFALGTDTAGSGRVPAALNNLIGFKPPVGSWSTKGVVPACASLDCVTVFTNNLSDVKTINEVAQGWDDECIYSKEYLIQQKIKCPSFIYLPLEEPTFYGPFKKRYAEGWRRTLTHIKAMGKALHIPVRTLDCNYLNKAASVLYDGPWVAERWADLGTFVKQHPKATFPVTETILRSGNNPTLSAEALFHAQHFIQKCRHQAKLDLKHAVLIMPTCGGTFTREEVDEDPIQTNSLMGLYTNHCNLCDLAALAIPADNIKNALPFRITAFSPSTEQNLLFGFAHAFNQQRS